MRPFDPQYFVPFPDGSYFMSFLDGRKTRAQIAKFSKKDVAAYDAYWAMWDRIIARMRPLLLRPVCCRRLSLGLSHLQPKELFLLLGC